MMKDFFLHIFGLIVRLCFRVRYKFRIKNKGALHQPKLKKGGYLILPNHPAEMDPIIMMTLLWGKYKLRPLVVEHFYYFPGAKIFMDAAKAIAIPNFENSVNQWKKDKGDKAFEMVLEGLKKGENFLVYPSGHLRRGSKEVVGGSSFVYNIIQAYPEVNILMVRMSGLWGSSFSRAITGSVPHFWKVVLKAIWTVIKNGIFFVPKRVVEVEYYNPGERFPYHGSKLEINQFLQNFYNRYLDDKNKVVSEEPLKLVSYSFYRKDLPKYVAALEDKSNLKVQVKLSLDEKKKILKKVSELAEVSVSDIDEEKDLSLDLGLDSLDIANLYVYITEEFDVVSKIEPGELKKVYDLFVLAADQKKSVRHGQQYDNTKTVSWIEEKKRPEPQLGFGKTIPEVFFNTAERMKNYVACADANSGILTYKRLLLGALILSNKIKKLPGQYIGIMLPSSVGVYLMILACQIAKKTTVMLNWTAGIRSLKYAVELLDIQVILSARKFLDRLEHLQLEEIEKKLYLVEDIRKSISLIDKLKALLLSKKSTKRLVKSLGLDHVKETDPAVVLFTSGTESYPKAVPLSHKNILTNQSISLNTIELKASDVLYGVLPPFHSFGFTVTGLLPLLGGFRVYFAPDPTDGHAMAQDIKHWKATVICLAPSFYTNLLKLATKEDLKTIRLFVSGAEKASNELKQMIWDLNDDNAFLEGYGITECSPVVSICDREDPIGVGKPIANLDVCVIHIDTHEVLPRGKVGEFCIHGPSVFYGYLGTPGRDPFIEIKGKKWYRSGDIGYLDEKGNIILQGRLKRFVKIGGEMISLTAIEEELVQQSSGRGWLTNQDDAAKAFVLCVKELENGKPHMVLFTTTRVTKEEINSLLRESGFGRIVKISEVRILDEIPLLGTGKINYRQLSEMVK
ncbi:MAG: acyl-[ACP]--phospholipid O-acyltransferase [Chlamydiales bacterium]|nr:acyl-[ACP]--phospholipid O-acyltransferase [Chlamydiales bacterium]